MADSRLQFDDATQPEAQRSAGTRFLVYAQAPYLAGYDRPETVWIARAPGQVRAGPQDNRMYVVDPLLEKEPYDYPYLPPFEGDTRVPAVPDYEGHFDHIAPNSRAFLSAHAFACVARVLDIWESYAGRPLPWHFSDTFDRLEIVPRLDWDDAQSGYGYLELGHEADGTSPHALNFDVIAHEVGHLILFSMMGFPQSAVTDTFAVFHEAHADLISLLSFLHFDSGLERLLRHCQGNLLVLNELNRIAELSGDRQIRVASNARRMSEVSGEVHDRSRPLTGAVFDTMVEAFHWRLVSEGIADERLLQVDIRNVSEGDLKMMSRLISADFQNRPFLYKNALIQAREEVAKSLVRAWDGLPADELSLSGYAERLAVEANRLRNGLGHQFEVNFAWREII